MTGSSSPCGACKFLRRKCVRGCVFAPYFCHEQGAAHFAAIHKVFGASNVSKLLAHLPVSDRPGAAITISYEAQARLKDPIYGCVSHIFALQQQVINLQAQLAFIKEQAGSQGFPNGSNGSTGSNPNDRYNNGRHYDQQVEYIQNWFQSENSNMVPQYYSPNPTSESPMTPYFDNYKLMTGSNSSGSCENVSVSSEDQNGLYGKFDEAYHFMSSLDNLQTVNREMGFYDSDDLRSMHFSNTRHS